MSNIFFSVVLTSYNSEKFIKKTLESLIGQNFKNFEVILIDDGSADNTVNIAKKIQIRKKINLNIITGVKNLFDEKYASMILINAKGFGGKKPRYYYPGLPRNYFISLNIKV